jgi:hypothetical protein
MENITDVNEICLQVFAKASAATSHEIKNTLSIINENAGLLDDLAVMAVEGQESGVPTQHIQSAVSIIMKQVARSNTIMKNLNTFAHSADTRLAQVNLGETLSLMVALTARQAAMKKLDVSISCPSDILIHTCLFPFESLLYLSLIRIYSLLASEATLRVEAAADGSNIIIRFREIGQSATLSEKAADEEIMLAKQIEGLCSSEDNNFSINFPRDIQKK